MGVRNLWMMMERCCLEMRKGSWMRRVKSCLKRRRVISIVQRWGRVTPVCPRVGRGQLPGLPGVPQDGPPGEHPDVHPQHFL